MNHFQHRQKAQERNTKRLLITSITGFAIGVAGLTMTDDKDYLILMLLTSISSLIALTTQNKHS